MISAAFFLLTCNYEKGIEHDGQGRKKPVCKTLKIRQDKWILVTVLLWGWQRLSGTLQLLVKLTPRVQSPFLAVRRVELLSMKNIQADGRLCLAILGTAGCVAVTQRS